MRTKSLMAAVAASQSAATALAQNPSTEGDSEHSASLLYPVPIEACPIDMWQLSPPEAR